MFVSMDQLRGSERFRDGYATARMGAISISI